MRVVARLLIAGALIAALGIPISAQTPPEPSIDSIDAPVATRATQPAAEQPWRPPHRFWDAGNIALAGGVAASRALDYDSTGHFRKLGNQEWLLTNRIVDNKPLFATIEVAGGAAAIGVAYWLHRTGHHRLERWALVLHTAVTTGGAIHNYSLDPVK